MSGASAAPPRVPPRATVAVSVENPSVWDRLTNWASENRTVVYTIAGVGVIVTGAGILYYLNVDSVSFHHVAAHVAARVAACCRSKEKNLFIILNLES